MDLNVAEIDWHDARVREIRSLPQGVVKVVFTSLVLWRGMDDAILESWSYSATLVLEGVKELSVRGVWSDNEFVADGDLVVEVDSGWCVAVLQSGLEATSFSLDFTAQGASLSIACSRARLEEVVPMKRLD